MDKCEQCGQPISDHRGGGQRKRFCSSSCRGRWHRGHPKVVQLQRKAPKVSTSGTLSRVASLERIAAELAADIEARGAMIEGRVNPAVESYRRICADLDRMAPASTDVDTPATVFDLHSV